MPNKTKYICLVGILIIAGFFRFYHLTTTPPGLYMDEAMDGVNAQNVAQTGQFKVYYPEDNGREGLYVNILAVAFKYHLLPDTAPWSVRFPAAVAGTLTVLGVYLLVSELFSESRKSKVESRKEDSESATSPSSTFNFTLSTFNSSIALLSAFLLATSFWHINFSRIGFRAILAPFCLVWACWFLLKAIRAVGGKRAAIYAILGGIIFGAGFYTYIAFRIMPLLLLLFVPFFRKYPGFWKRAILFLFVTFLVALPIGWYYLHNPADFLGRTSQISVTSSASPIATIAMNTVQTALMFNWRGDGNWRHNFSGAPELFWTVGILFLIGLMLSVYYLFKKTKVPPLSKGRWRSFASPVGSLEENVCKPSISFSLPTVGGVPSGQTEEPPLTPPWKGGGADSIFGILFLWLWFLLAALPEILSNDGIPHALRSLLMVIPAVAFAAIGGVWLYAWFRAHWKPIFIKTLAVIFFLAVAVGAYSEYFVSWAGNPNVPGSFNAGYVAIGEQINALPSSTQKYVVIYAGGVIDYGLPMPAEPVLYVTHSFVPDAAAQKFVNNIHYLLPDETSQIPTGTPSNTIFEIR
jgi:4-amino-4-deoxy-L-arabinose transferase-like glycosyltransferase